MSFRSLIGLVAEAKRLAATGGAIRRGAPSSHPLYSTWAAMLARCYNQSNPSYAAYGGRGIRVHDEWRMSFYAFAEYMGQRPPQTSIDRIDNDGHYEPGNVRWASKAVQIHNRRNTKWVEFRGERLPLSVWARRLGIKTDTLKTRLLRGTPVEIALTEKRIPNHSGLRLGAAISAAKRRNKGVENGRV